jgi:primase-polymerase (primpol)-like protein
METKPKRVDIQFKNIPAELRRKAQWVTWRWELRDNEWTKPPYDPKTHQLASVADPSTWSDFKTAFQVYQSGLILQS